jgi:hypothetical protein
MGRGDRGAAVTWLVLVVKSTIRTVLAKRLSKKVKFVVPTRSLELQVTITNLDQFNQRRREMFLVVPIAILELRLPQKV